MPKPKLIFFDHYLDSIFDDRTWIDACVNMLSNFLEDIYSYRVHPRQSLPGIAPSMVDQDATVSDRATRTESAWYGLRLARQRKGVSHDGAIARLTVVQVLWLDGSGASEDGRRQNHGVPEGHVPSFYSIDGSQHVAETWLDDPPGRHVRDDFPSAYWRQRLRNLPG